MFNFEKISTLDNIKNSALKNYVALNFMVLRRLNTTLLQRGAAERWREEGEGGHGAAEDRRRG